MAAIFVNVHSIVRNRLVLTIDNHKNVEKVLAITFTIDRAVNHLNAGCATLENCLTWYRIIAIVGAEFMLAFSGRSEQVDIRHSRSDEAVKLEGPIRPVGEHNILCRKIVAIWHVKAAARVR